MLRRSPEFTISAYLKQEIGNTGIILSFVQGVNRYLELESSGRRNEIRFHYLSKEDNKVHVETFHYKLADNLWHRMTVTVSGSVVELFVDCNRLYKRLLRPGKPDRNFTEAKQLWLGQRSHLYHYKVSTLFKCCLYEKKMRLNDSVERYPKNRKKIGNNSSASLSLSSLLIYQ